MLFELLLLFGRVPGIQIKQCREGGIHWKEIFEDDKALQDELNLWRMTSINAAVYVKCKIQLAVNRIFNILLDDSKLRVPSKPTLSGQKNSQIITVSTFREGYSASSSCNIQKSYYNKEQYYTCWKLLDGRDCHT